MSRTLPQPKIPKTSSIFPEGKPPKSRHKMQFPKTGIKPPKVTKYKPQKLSVSMVKPQSVKVTRTTKAR